MNKRLFFIPILLLLFLPIVSSAPTISMDQPKNISYPTSTVDLNYSFTGSSLSEIVYNLDDGGEVSVDLEVLEDDTEDWHDVTGNSSSRENFWDEDFGTQAVLGVSDEIFFFNYTSTFTNWDSVWINISGTSGTSLQSNLSCWNTTNGVYEEVKNNTNPSVSVVSTNITVPFSCWGGGSIDFRLIVPLFSGWNEEKIVYVNFSNTSLTGLSDGSHSLDLSINETDGESAVANVNFTINFFPSVDLITPLNGTNSSNSLDYNFTSDKDISLANYSLDGGDNRSMGNTSLTDWGNSSVDHPVLSNGLHNITYYAFATNGNNASETFYFTIDTVFPTITFVSPLNHPITNNTPVLDVDLSDALNGSVTAWYNINETTNTTPIGGVTNLTVQLGVFPDNIHNITVWANDSADNVALSTVIFTVNVSDPPTIGNISTIVSTTQVVISFDTSEVANSTIWYGTVSGTLNQKISHTSALISSHTRAVTGLSASTTYYFVVEACDLFDNCGNSSESSFLTDPISIGGGPSAPPGGGGGGAVIREKPEITIEVVTAPIFRLEDIVRDYLEDRINFETFVQELQDREGVSGLSASLTGIRLALFDKFAPAGIVLIIVAVLGVVLAIPESRKFVLGTGSKDMVITRRKTIVRIKRPK